VTTVPLKVALAAAAAGGIIGALARAGLTDWFPVGSGFPWTVFAINVAGSALLAGLPALDVVRRTPWLGVFLGTGVMGGFTTMSAASAETVSLFEHDRTGTGIAYIAGTLVVALLAVRLVEGLTTPGERAAAERDEVDA
jgi:CrcB protein